MPASGWSAEEALFKSWDWIPHPQERGDRLPLHGCVAPHDHPHVYLNISEQNDILRDVPRFLACEAGQAIVERSCDLRQ